MHLRVAPLPFCAVIAVFCAVTAMPGRAASPGAIEMMELDRKLAQGDCREHRDSAEIYLAGAVGNAERYREVQKRMNAVDAQEAPLRKRRSELLRDGVRLSEEDYREVQAVRAAIRESCPWEDLQGMGVPYNLEPARSREEALQYVRVLVPQVLVKWRMCEVYDPRRKGELERGWSRSRLSRLEIPELQATVGEVRAWMKDGYDTVHPDSRYAGPEAKANLDNFCRGAAELKQLEAALPADFLRNRGK